MIINKKTYPTHITSNGVHRFVGNPVVASMVLENSEGKYTLNNVALEYYQEDKYTLDELTSPHG